MKKIILSAILMVCCYLGAKAQTSSNTIDYMISFDAVSSTYTAWVVPNYSTPNSNNADLAEKGITAQFSIKVPKGFTISNIVDVHGEWEKNPLRIGGQPQFIQAGVDATYEYYIIGKTPVETDFGSFTSGHPVAMFTFKGEPAKSDIKLLEATDSFVNLAVNQFALNVQPSFYSRSGQRASLDAMPMEQFTKGITLDELNSSTKNGVAPNFKPDPSANSNEIMVYPNPVVTNEVNVKFFSLAKDSNTQITIMDASGKTLKTETISADSGFNDSKITLAGLQAGIYYVKTKVGGVVSTSKIVK